MTKRILKPLIAAAIIFLTTSFSFAYEQEQDAGDLHILQGDSPSGPAVFLRPIAVEKLQPHASWMLRTGIRKGIRGLTFEGESDAAPDVAVLKAGFFEQWIEFLYGMKEPSAPAGADTVSGLAKTRPVLVIPSGGLAGSSGSEFFKAGLAEYARSGGAIICFAQRTGADYSALPVPAGSPIEAIGWAEDPGPVFGASFIRTSHPVLSRMTGTAPRLETSGYVATAPKGAQVVLARSDGFPTLIIYPFGSGVVVVTTLFTDVLFGQGHLDPEERMLVEDLLLWSKSPSRTGTLSPGERMNVTFSVQGAEKDAAGVKFSLIGPGSAVSAPDQVIQTPVKAFQKVPVPFVAVAPPGAPAGVYHYEYTLLGKDWKPISPRAECAEGRFSIGQPPLAASSAKPLKPLRAIPDRLRIQPTADRRDGAIRLGLDLLATTPAASLSGDELLIRVSGREKTVALAQPRVSLSFDIPEKEADVGVPVAIYHSGGRLLLRETVPVVNRDKRGVIPDRTSYLPGEQARVRVSGFGGGELSLSGLGRIENDVVRENGSILFPVPDDLPAGAYPLAWEIGTTAGFVASGLVSVNVAGYQVTHQDVTVTARPDGQGRYAVTALIGVQATRQLAGRIMLTLRGPGGTIVPAAESDVTLSPGRQDVPLRFSFKPEASGIWELSSVISAGLPEGIGFPPGPMPVASGRALFDVGDAAVLALTTDKPVYYDPAGPVEISTFAYGKGKAKLFLFMDDDKVFKERTELSGRYAASAPVPDANPGAHALRAELESGDLFSSRELTVVYGADLPDLTTSIVTSEPAGADLDAGIGIKNEGKAASPKCRAELYDGDPGRGGRRIGKVDVPPLEPGQTHIAIMKWSLFKKTGMRDLVALADTGNAVPETNEINNRSSMPLFVPDHLLNVSTAAKEFGVNEPVSYSLNATNLTSSGRKSLSLDVQLLGPGGMAVLSDVVPVNELPAAKTISFDRKLTPAAPLSPGTYLLTARLSAGQDILANTLTEVRIPPVLALAGSLAGTPTEALLCAPFTMQYNVRSTGNIPVSSGFLKIEMQAPGAARPEYTRQLPFSMDTKTFRIDSMDLPAGRYSVLLKASVKNLDHNKAQESVLAEQPLTVSGPIRARATGELFPRVLVWMGNAGGSAGRAQAEDLVTQAFEQEGLYYKVVSSPDDFSTQAMSGMFNAFVLLDVSDPLESPGWLKGLTEHGQGMVIVGADETAKAAADVFGFTFGEPLSNAGATLALAPGPAFGLSGTIPAAGTVLLAKKRGAAPLAFKAGTKEPAAFLDRSGGGKVLLLPFSLLRSSRDSGAAGVYSLLLQAAVRSAIPEREVPGDFSAAGFSLSAPEGTTKAKITLALPEGSQLVWANHEGTTQGDGATYDLTLDAEPKRIMFLYTAADVKKTKPVLEVFYECGGKWVSQGKAE